MFYCCSGHPYKEDKFKKEQTVFVNKMVHVFDLENMLFLKCFIVVAIFENFEFQSELCCCLLFPRWAMYHAVFLKQSAETKPEVVALGAPRLVV